MIERLGNDPLKSELDPQKVLKKEKQGCLKQERKSNKTKENVITYVTVLKKNNGFQRAMAALVFVANLVSLVLFVPTSKTYGFDLGVATMLTPVFFLTSLFLPTCHKSDGFLASTRFLYRGYISLILYSSSC